MATPNSSRKYNRYFGDSHFQVKPMRLYGPCYYCHLHIKLLLHYIILLLLLSHCRSESNRSVEVEALLKLSNDLNDTNERIKDWSGSLVSPCYSWSHVICDHDGGNVISLSLGSLGFTGKLTSSITDLKFLTSLDLHNNNLSDELPDLSSLMNLQNLNLSRNKFSGSIPTSWNQLSNLNYLDLSSNNLSGKIPEKLFSSNVFKNIS
ncbi:MDIS1-interacting receptor like kinase 1-like isoform X2 [Rutidosis leptorrhynchoides]|uniref:MDIS1-interacting receptor like kinase 1-like isoform X2 n=1 Tax=Rutidosis leptorrhynchoides TaxID=125765 RepID=UPI003A9A3194